jgi:hypothetical protein
MFPLSVRCSSAILNARASTILERSQLGLSPWKAILVAPRTAFSTMVHLPKPQALYCSNSHRPTFHLSIDVEGERRRMHPLKSDQSRAPR